MENDFSYLQKEFTDFKTHILEYIAGLKEWQKTTIGYREDLRIELNSLRVLVSDKFSCINNKLTELPCKVTQSEIIGLKASIARLWAGFVAVIILGIAIKLWMDGN